MSFYSCWTIKLTIRLFIKASCHKMQFNNMSASTVAVTRVRLWKVFSFQHWNKPKLYQSLHRSLDFSKTFFPVLRFWLQSLLSLWHSQHQPLESFSSGVQSHHLYALSHHFARSPSWELHWHFFARKQKKWLRRLELKWHRIESREPLKCWEWHTTNIIKFKNLILKHILNGWELRTLLPPLRLKVIEDLNPWEMFLRQIMNVNVVMQLWFK